MSRLAPVLAILLAVPSLVSAANFVTFESGPVRPLALSPDGTRLFAVNTPDNTLEVFTVGASGLTHTDAIPVGMEPVAVAARNNNEVWVVNHLSDSISVISMLSSPPRVVATLLVGDEPRDIVFAGTGGNRAFITTAHRGQHRTHASISGVTGAGDPQLTTPSTLPSPIGRADVWVFDATALGTTLGGTPVEILTFFSDTPRALAVSGDGLTVYVAAFHSGNQTTAITETVVCNNFSDTNPSCGVPVPDDNAAGVPAPETGLIVKFDGGIDWNDALGRDWNSEVRFDLPDHDVFAVDADSLVHGLIFDSVGTILFNMVVNPISGMIYVTNTELPNHVRFEGAGNHGGSTVQGHLSETRITVLDPNTPSVDVQHLNQHIDYSLLHTSGSGDPNQILHSLATPMQTVVSSDGATLYMAAFGSAKVGVFTSAQIEDASFEANFLPEVASAGYLATGGGPGGLALDETHDRLYVLTRFNNSVEVIDLLTSSSEAVHALHNPEPPKVVNGRPFLYDAVNTSGNGEASCASCHIFGDLDSLAWNLGDPDADTSINNQPSATPLLPAATTFHPMKGPMTTQTLRGLATHGAMHWRGDRADGFFPTDPCTESSGAPCKEDQAFRNFIVAFEGLVGHDGPIAEADMTKFSDFALEIFQPPNPVRALDNSLTTSEQAGEDLYFSEGTATDETSNGRTDLVEDCEGCHSLDASQGFFGSGGAQTFEGEPQNFKVPHLRNAYSKIGMFGLSAGGPDMGDQIRGFGYLHDGSVDRLRNFLAASAFQLSFTEELELEQFILAFPSDLAPIVGQQATLTISNAAAVDPRIDLLIARAGASFNSLTLGGLVTECELIVKGSVLGVERGWVLQGSSFIDDVGGSIGDAALRSLATTQGPLTYTCVPPGSGVRAGIDRDLDTLLNGFETNTGTFVSATNTGSDPAKADTDGDGVDDGVEVDFGTDPNNAASFPAIPLLPGTLVGLFACLLGVAVGRLSRRNQVRR